MSNKTKKIDTKSNWQLLSPEMIDYAKKAAATKETAVALLQKAGLVDSNGKVAKQYA